MSLDSGIHLRSLCSVASTFLYQPHIYLLELIEVASGTMQTSSFQCEKVRATVNFSIISFYDINRLGVLLKWASFSACMCVEHAKQKYFPKQQLPEISAEVRFPEQRTGS